jgi:acyl-[acyl carrier protein]--UDP-N-acetylglucosamine O-acyltransferase
VHDSAIVDSRAVTDPMVDVGSCVAVAGPARVGPGTRVHPFPIITGRTNVCSSWCIWSGVAVMLRDGRQVSPFGGGVLVGVNRMRWILAFASKGHTP